MQTIYLDVLIGVNVYINYLLLVLTARFAACRQERTRMVLAAFVGALSSCTILLDIPSVFISAAIKLVTVTVMTLMGFEIKSHRMLIKLMLILTAVTFGFAGAMIGLQNIMSTNNISVANFSVYLDISPLTLIFMTLICYILLSVCSKIAAGKTKQKAMCRLTVTNLGRSVTVDGLLDTGNTLTEPFSGLPVVVVSEKSAEKVIPSDVMNFDISAPQLNKSVRLIPYSSVGGKGLLKGFMPECITVECEGKESRTKDVYVAVTDRQSDVPALINPDILY